MCLPHIYDTRLPPSQLPTTNILLTLAFMPSPTSRARASRAIRRATSLAPSSHPLRQSLRVLSNPLTYQSSYTCLDEPTWQVTLNEITTFADRVIQTLDNQLDNNVMSSLQQDALQLHTTLDQKGFHTAFQPSHIYARSFSVLQVCSNHSERTESNIRLVTSSLSATYQCLENIFKAPIILVDPVEAICKVADHHRQKTPPPANAVVSCADITEFEKLQFSHRDYMEKLSLSHIPEQSRERIRTFVDLLWQPRTLSDKNIIVDGMKSQVPNFDLLGSTDHSIVISAVLPVTEDVSPDSRKLWTARVVLKSLRFPVEATKRRVALQQELLRLKLLSHPCIPVYYGAIWPGTERETPGACNVHLVTEQMTQSIRAGRNGPALQSFEVRMRILQDVADALRFLHIQRVFHGSLSPENILIRTYDSRIYGRAKVDVTGLAARAMTGEFRKRPLVYRPPESSVRQSYFTSDMWTFGVLACFLLADLRDEENDSAYIEAVARRGISGSVAQDWAKRIRDDRARELVLHCLSLQPEKRPCAEEAYIHISGILRQKAVKPDTVGLSAAPTKGQRCESVQDSQELTTDSHVNCHETHAVLKPRSSPGNPSLKMKQSPLTARKTAPLPQQECVTGDSVSAVKPMQSSRQSKWHERLGNRRTGECDTFTNDISYEAEPSNCLNRNADKTDQTCGIKRKTSSEASTGTLKRAKLDQEGVQKTSDVTSGLHQATMEEIFGPFSEDSDTAAVSGTRQKQEDVLEKHSSRNTTLGGNTQRVKVEATISVSQQAAKRVTSCISEQQRKDEVLGIAGRRVRAKAEPRLDIEKRVAIDMDTRSRGGTDVDNEFGISRVETETGAAKSIGAGASTSGGILTSANKPPVLVKQESRRQRGSRKEKRRSRNDSAAGGDKDNKWKQSNVKPPVESWKGRIRKRRQISFKYRDRSLSPVPSTSSYGADSNVSYPSESVCDIAESCSALEMPKGLGRGKESAKRSLASSERSQSEHDVLRKTKNGSSTSNFNGKEDLTLEFVRRAREGESLPDFYRREALNGNISAFVQLGILYEEGQFVKCDYDMAFSSYQQAASAGDSEGQLRLARCYEDGRGVSKSESAAAALYIQAADADNAHAQFRAGVCFEEGKGVVRDIGKALRYLNKAAEQRDPEACHRIAGLYKEGKATKKDEAKAFVLYKVASDAGHVQSMVQLASMYAKGAGGVKRSIAKAVLLYRQASDEGDPEAKLSLGLLHEDGQGVKKSSESALKLYREAADAGHAPAMTALGQCLLWGYGVKQSFDRAVALFRNAAKQGDSLAYHELGNCYRDGNGVKQDYVKALYLYKKAAAQESAVSLVQCGEFLYSGHGVPQDYEKAYKYFQQAADLGAAEGYRWLGECYADGTGVRENPNKAFLMYKKGAELGSSNAETCLGVCYEKGNGVERSRSKALQWYRKAASNGNHTAMNNLGIFYEQGTLVKRDAKRAVSYYRKAIDLGSVDAICNLADCYASGNGIKRDMAMAVQHYQDAAAYGLFGAKCELGVCYYYGKGVAQNVVRAAELFSEASESEPEALRHLGTCYYDGKGVQRDCGLAIRLYEKAISKGNVDANFNLALCYSYGKGVSPDDKKAASLLETAANNGNRYAKLSLGNRYFEGRGVAQDFARAVSLFKEAGDVDFSQPLTDERILDDEAQQAETKS